MLAPDGPLRLSEGDEPEPDLFFFPATIRVNDVRGADKLLVVEVAFTQPLSCAATPDLAVRIADIL